MSELIWWPHKGYGFQAPNQPHPYDDKYFAHCQAQERTKVGRKLLLSRLDFLGGHGKRVVDVGVGGGSFCELADCSGFDINPNAVTWLKSVNRFHDLERNECEIACFWDSLEHILSPEVLIKNVKREVFISMPIYESAEHVIKSKHYKPNEHLWYFTENGLIRWMNERGFYLVERNRDEERFGREDIGSYRFCRGGTEG